MSRPTNAAGTCRATPPNSTDPKHIEVKGRAKGAATITVSRNEILYAFNQGDKFVLAIVLREPRTTVSKARSTFADPFEREPDWGVSSINYNLSATCSRKPATVTRDHPVISPKKLIEVALPLDAINTAAANRRKSIRHGHPSTLHLWWAQRPLAAARAVIFAQLVHDPEDLWRCQNPGQEPNQQVTGHWTKARAKLFKIIEDLVLWENTTNEAVLKPAREAIRQSWRETCELNKDHPQAKELFNPAKMPGLHDPFAGGGTIPLEAQRLGLEAFASDLNPVAVLINKAMIEIPPKFAGKPPVHPDAKNPLLTWSGAAGLGRGRSSLWGLDARRSLQADRPSLSADRDHEGDGQRPAGPRTIRRREAHRHRLALGADCEKPEPGVLARRRAARQHVHPEQQGRERILRRAGDRKSGYKFTVKVGKPPAEAKAGTKAAEGHFRCLDVATRR